jgi:hypothetical protein
MFEIPLEYIILHITAERNILSIFSTNKNIRLRRIRGFHQ